MDVSSLESATLLSRKRSVVAVLNENHRLRCLFMGGQLKGKTYELYTQSTLPPIYLLVPRFLHKRCIVCKIVLVIESLEILLI